LFRIEFIIEFVSLFQTMGSKNFSQFSSFKIVLLYTIVSVIYLYASDYFLTLFIPDVRFLSELQMEKGLVFILVTAIFLYLMVKRIVDKTSAYYQHLMKLQETSDLQIQASQEEYMTLFNHSPLPMWIFDTETMRFILVNNAACESYGYSHEEFATMTLKDIRPLEDIPIMEQMLANAIKSEATDNSNVVRHRKKNGTIIQVKLKTSKVLFEGKHVRLASAMDITTEMDAQSKLIESNSRLRVASEIAGLGYWTHDLPTHKIQWSQELY